MALLEAAGTDHIKQLFRGHQYTEDQIKEIQKQRVQAYAAELEAQIRAKQERRRAERNASLIQSQDLLAARHAAPPAALPIGGQLQAGRRPQASDGHSGEDMRVNGEEAGARALADRGEAARMTAAALQKLNYRAELEAQLREQEAKKRADRRQKLLDDLRIAQEAAAYNPWGRGGCGAPLRSSSGRAIADLSEAAEAKRERDQEAAEEARLAAEQQRMRDKAQEEKSHQHVRLSQQDSGNGSPQPSSPQHIHLAAPVDAQRPGPPKKSRAAYGSEEEDDGPPWPYHPKRDAACSEAQIESAQDSAHDLHPVRVAVSNCQHKDKERHSPNHEQPHRQHNAGIGPPERSHAEHPSSGRESFPLPQIPDALDRWSQDQGLALANPQPWKPGPVSRPPAYPRQYASSLQYQHPSTGQALRPPNGHGAWTPYGHEEADSREDLQPRNSHAAAAQYHQWMPHADVSRDAIGLPPTDPSRAYAPPHSRQEDPPWRRCSAHPGNHQHKAAGTSSGAAAN
ncbi:hypothetical protein WJX84_005078 [Apatococcus fuscideae]|uniref:Uncharacterized protein n=1 Tax=Apatococcus fuscideae TaxID=2026836 RepID=A0AAW1SM39_9CHLO